MSPGVPGPSAVPSAPQMKWYVVKVQSGREESIKQALERHVKIEGMDAALGRIVIPTEKIAELRQGRRVERRRKLFAGYLVCEVAVDDAVRSLFREVPGVNDFVGGGGVPVPLSPREVQALLAGEARDEVKEVLPEFSPGDPVTILGGAFAQMEGEVESVHPDSGQVRVRVTILGRKVSLDVEPFALRRLTADR